MFGVRCGGWRASGRSCAARLNEIDLRANHVFGVNSTLPLLCAAFVMASPTWETSEIARHAAGLA
jgi:hypothetical protein